jgi:hypothetical protein
MTPPPDGVTIPISGDNEPLKRALSEAENLFAAWAGKLGAGSFNIFGQTGTAIAQGIQEGFSQGLKDVPALGAFVENLKDIGRIDLGGLGKAFWKGLDTKDFKRNFAIQMREGLEGIEWDSGDSKFDKWLGGLITKLKDWSAEASKHVKQTILPAGAGGGVAPFASGAGGAGGAAGGGGGSILGGLARAGVALATSVVPGLGWASLIELIGEAITGVIKFGFSSVTAFSEAEQSAVRLEGVLRSTGNTTGFNTEQMKAMNEELQRNAGITETAGNTMAATFTRMENIRGPIFDRAMRQTADLAAALGTTAPNAARMLADALDNPAQGMMRLHLSGIKFSQIEQERIKMLQDSMQLQKAQAEVLDVVAKKSQGQAVAKSMTFEGTMDRFGVLWDKYMTKLGAIFAPLLEAIAGGAETGFDQFGYMLDAFADVMKEYIIPAFSIAVAALQNVAHVIEKIASIPMTVYHFFFGGGDKDKSRESTDEEGESYHWYYGARGRHKKSRNLTPEEQKGLGPIEPVERPLEQRADRTGIGAFEDIAEMWKRISTAGSQRLVTDVLEENNNAQAARDAEQLAVSQRQLTAQEKANDMMEKMHDHSKPGNTSRPRLDY